MMTFKTTEMIPAAPPNTRYQPILVLTGQSFLCTIPTITITMLSGKDRYIPNFRAPETNPTMIEAATWASTSSFQSSLGLILFIGILKEKIQFLLLSSYYSPCWTKIALAPRVHFRMPWSLSRLAHSIKRSTWVKNVEKVWFISKNDYTNHVSRHQASKGLIKFSLRPSYYTRDLKIFLFGIPNVVSDHHNLLKIIWTSMLPVSSSPFLLYIHNNDCLC